MGMVLRARHNQDPLLLNSALNCDYDATSLVESSVETGLGTV